MSLALSLLAAEESHHVNELPLPPIVFGLIALAIFVSVAIVFWSFRDVANRHTEKAERYARENKGSSH